MGLFEIPIPLAEKQVGAGRRRVRRRPRTRRCLLKGCPERFRPRQRQHRYCSPACRGAARRWSSWKAQQKYRATAAGQQKRNAQSVRHRERARRRQAEQPTASTEPARVITPQAPEDIFRARLLRPPGLL